MHPAIRTPNLRLTLATLCLIFLAMQWHTDSRAATAPPSAATFTCPPTRPSAAPIVPDDFSKGTMVVTPMQIVFDTCRVAVKLNQSGAPSPSEVSSAVEERMRTITLETPKETDDPRQTNQEFADMHEWGCGPYPTPTPALAGVSLAPSAPLVNPCHITPKRPYKKPSALLSRNFTMHPPVDQAEVVYDLCVAAYDLSKAPVGRAADPKKGILPLANAVKSPTDGLGVLWDVRFAHLLTEVHLFLTCARGRADYPPSATNADYSRDRNYGCGPYIQPL